MEHLEHREQACCLPMLLWLVAKCIIRNSGTPATCQRLRRSLCDHAKSKWWLMVTSREAISMCWKFPNDTSAWSFLYIIIIQYTLTQTPSALTFVVCFCRYSHPNIRSWSFSQAVSSLTMKPVDCIMKCMRADSLWQHEHVSVGVCHGDCAMWGMPLVSHLAKRRGNWEPRLQAHYTRT